MAPKAAVEWSTQRWPIVFFGLVLYLDLVASCLQYVVLEDYLADFWNPMSFFYDMMYFNSSYGLLFGRHFNKLNLDSFGSLLVLMPGF
jgi:hypothetical protein